MPAEGERSGALRDIRIVDLTQMLAGPFCTMMLADHGAEVIKVESPQGDMTRIGGVFPKDDTQRTHSGYFQSVNRNKQSVCLNLKSESGRKAFLRLVEKADAVIENFRHGVMDRLGLGYEVLRGVNPKLVYGSLRGFGDSRTGQSPYMEWPAFDVVAQAMGGIIGITGPDERTPTKVGPGVGDIAPGMMLAFGVLSAIHNARNTGRGQFVDVAMIDAVLSTCERMVYQYSMSGVVPGPEGNHHPFIAPFGLFPVSDGLVTIAAQQDGFFSILCAQLDLNDWMADERFNTLQGRAKHRRALIEELSSVTARYSKAELTDRLGGKVPFGPVMRMDTIAADPHFHVREMIVELEQPGSATTVHVAGTPIKLSETPGGVRVRAPYIGEHTRAVLQAVGVTNEEFELWSSDGSVVQHEKAGS